MNTKVLHQHSHVQSLATTILAVFFATSCNMHVKDGRTNRGALQPVIDNPVPPTVPPPNQVASYPFSVLDPNIDFSNNSAATAAALNTKFPVRNMDTEIALLKDGNEFLAARWQILSGATKSVRLQSLVFHGDESGWLLARKLVELKKRNIAVSVIIDSISSLYPEDQNMFLYLQQNGIKVEGYDVMYLYLLQEIAKTDTVTDLVDRTNQRYHEKMLIVDGEDPSLGRAIIGGVNIANKYFQIDRSKFEENWLDKDVIIRGAMVADISKSFDENLVNFQSFRANTALFNTTPLWSLALKVRDVLKFKPVLPRSEPELDANLVVLVNKAANTSMSLAWKPVLGRFLKSRPQLKEFYINAAYIDAIKNAKSEILILNSYFLPTADFSDALKAAVRRGVNVKILTNSKETADYRAVIEAGRTLYPDLLSVNLENKPGTAALTIYEWGGEPIFKNGYGLHHAKYAVIDSQLTIVGSYNIDSRSRNLNSETVVVFAQPDLAKDLRDEFVLHTGPTYASVISYNEALKFKDPDGLLKKLKARFLEAFRVIM